MARNGLRLVASVFVVASLGFFTGCAFCKAKPVVEPTPPPPPPPAAPLASACLENYSQATEIPNDTDKYVVNADSVAELKAIANCLSKNPDVTVRIEGHADYRGTLAYNQALSQRRVDAAKDVLVQNGVNPANIVGEAFGETKPIAQGRDAASLARNRVTFVIVVQ